MNDPTGGHIYKITDPGVAKCFDTPFFACAGAGEPLAKTQFMVARYDKTWPVEKALWLTFTAKARAEMAGGVGSETDLVLITAGRKHTTTDAENAALYRLFRRTAKKEAAASAEAMSEVLQYLQSEAAKEATSGEMTQTAPTTETASTTAESRPETEKKPRRKPKNLGA